MASNYYLFFGFKYFKSAGMLLVRSSVFFEGFLPDSERYDIVDIFRTTVSFEIFLAAGMLIE